jgi:hypothetical protein
MRKFSMISRDPQARRPLSLWTEVWPTQAVRHGGRPSIPSNPGICREKNKKSYSDTAAHGGWDPRDRRRRRRRRRRPVAVRASALLMRALLMRPSRVSVGASEGRRQRFSDGAWRAWADCLLDGANETRRETEGAVKGRRRGGCGAGVFAGQVGIG